MDSSAWVWFMLLFFVSCDTCERTKRIELKLDSMQRSIEHEIRMNCR